MNSLVAGALALVALLSSDSAVRHLLLMTASRPMARATSQTARSVANAANEAESLLLSTPLALAS